MSQTTVLVDAERGGDALDETIGDSDDGAVAAITVAELRVGFVELPGVSISDGD